MCIYICVHQRNAEGTVNMLKTPRNISPGVGRGHSQSQSEKPHSTSVVTGTGDAVEESTITSSWRGCQQDPFLATAGDANSPCGQVSDFYSSGHRISGQCSLYLAQANWDVTIKDLGSSADCSEGHCSLSSSVPGFPGLCIILWFRVQRGLSWGQVLVWVLTSPMTLQP